MINKNLPEPEEKLRYCCICGKKKRLSGKRIHWPDENCTKEKIKIRTGEEIETFSTWTYICQWCKANITKKIKQRVNYDNPRSL